MVTEVNGAFTWGDVHMYVCMYVYMYIYTYKSWRGVVGKRLRTLVVFHASQCPLSPAGMVDQLGTRTVMASIIDSSTGV
jgi:hypothetical protein